MFSAQIRTRLDGATTVAIEGTELDLIQDMVDLLCRVAVLHVTGRAPSDESRSDQALRTQARVN